ncbi:MOSC domain-containing protein [bacterium]|nr:MOSC domain-containing protein [bacterium]
MTKKKDSANKYIGKVIGVATGRRRGESKTKVPYIDLKEGIGVLGDAHSGTEKQVSLVSINDIDYMNKTYNISADIGSFAENIVISGLDLFPISPGDMLSVGPVVLKVVRIGKEPEEARMHTFSFKGYTLLPQKGVFCEVIKGGRIRPEDEVSFLPSTNACADKSEQDHSP